jgi:signal peptide peptidase SppA
MQLTGLPLLSLGDTKWAIRRDALPRLVEAQRIGVTPAFSALAGHLEPPKPQIARKPGRAAAGSTQRVGGGVAIVPLCGVLMPRPSFLSMLFGGGRGGLIGFRENFREAIASPDIGAVVIDVDSPGGLVSLCPETATEIADARGSKPIIAVVNCLAASGAYWIASQADEIVMTPSGDVGSIGVYMLHEDWSKFNEEFGVNPTFVSAGRFKVEGNSEEPLSEAGQAAWQADVNATYDQFVAAVAAGRGVEESIVRETYGEGRVLNATDALEVGMVDRIDTIEAVIGDLLSSDSTGQSALSVGRQAVLSPMHAADDEDDEEEQPRCPGCGKFLSTGQTECTTCSESDENENENEEEEEDDQEDDAPKGLDQAERTRAAAVLTSL